MFNEITRFVNWLRRRNPTADTAKSYQYHLHKFIEVVGDCAPTAVTLHDIDAFIEFQADRGLKSSSINRSLTAVASFYHFLADEDPTIECPVLRHRHLLRDRQRLPRAVPRGEVEKLFAVMDNGHFDAAQCKRDRAIFLLMLRSGLRVCEVASLTLPDLFLEERPPRLHIHGKNGRERAVYLSAETVTALACYLDGRPPVLHELVFLTYAGQGIGVRGIQKRLQQYRQAAGVHLTAHQLRHNFANNLVLADVPVTSIQKLLGHAWVGTTQNYIAANDAKVKADFVKAAAWLEAWQ
ncbi:MAG TPA: tyrosine-type recombinase/integrase [Chloroflexota bacterium]|nr:tyrosine-type recombinase/integrase [Chloroflexota bacterium]